MTKIIRRATAWESAIFSMAFVLPLLISTAEAATYQYAGHNFTQFTAPYTAADHVTGTLQLDDPLPANCVKCEIQNRPGFVLLLSDGVRTKKTGTDPLSGAAFVYTDSAGRITQWFMSLGPSINDNITTIFLANNFFSDSTAFNAENANVEVPGTWTAIGAPPPSGSACNGVFHGGIRGDLVVSQNQICVLSGGGVTGNVTANGGFLSIKNVTIDGNLNFVGAAAFSVVDSTVRGNLSVSSLRAGAPLSPLCGTQINGNLSLQANNGQINVGGPQCSGNRIGGNASFSGNDGPIGVYGNKVGGNLSTSGNRGTLLLYKNRVSGNLACVGNTTIFGAGNIAATKTGQCSKF
jgi:hypothetical protein